MIPENINLVPRRLIAKRGNKKKAIIGGLSAVIIIVVVSLVYLSLTATVRTEEQKLARLQERMSQLQSAIQTYQVFQQDETDLLAQETLLSTTKTGEILWSEVLDHISLIIPDNVQLDSFHGDSAEGPQFRINGTAPDFEGVAALLIRLRSSEQFDNVLLNTTTLATDGNIGFDFSAVVLSLEEQVTPDGG